MQKQNKKCKSNFTPNLDGEETQNVIEEAIGTIINFWPRKSEGIVNLFFFDIISV